MSPISRYTMIALSVLVLGVLVTGSAGYADDNVAVTVRLIKASSDGSSDKKIPSGLDELRQDLASFPYNVFQQVTAKSTRATVGSSSTIGLSYGLSLEVKPVSSSANMHSISVKLVESGSRTLLNMTIRTRPGSYTLIGGPKVDDSVLILAVTAK